MYLKLQISVVLTVCNYISPFKNIPEIYGNKIWPFYLQVASHPCEIFWNLFLHN